MEFDSVFKTEDERTPEYWREVAFMEFVVDLEAAMDAHGLNRKDLAKRLGNAPSHVTQTLRGDGDMRLLSMVKFAMAVGRIVHIHLAHPHDTSTWTDRRRRDRQGEYVVSGGEPARHTVDRTVRGGLGAIGVAAFQTAA